MSNYTKTTDFEAKDSLPTGDSGKIIRGAEFETEFDAISTAIATKADTAGPTFTGTLTFETISDGTIGVTAFVDEDNMASNSATLVPTQQSVKAYVDAVTTELQAQDLDFQADSGGALSIDLDTETMTFTGGTGITTAGLANDVTFAIDSTVTTLTGTQTLTNKTLTAPVISTISNTGTITLPTSTDTLVGRDTTDTLTNKTLTSAVLNTGVSGTAVLDEDDMVSDSATQLATQQSIKAYVDATVAATNELVEDTTPQLGGDLDTNGNDILFADNDKAVFGAGSDLTIFSDGGTFSYINNTQGVLRIRNTSDDQDVAIQSDNGSGGVTDYFLADGSSGAVKLYNYGSQKLATTSTGIDVTGVAVVDGLTSSAAITSTSNSNSLGGTAFTSAISGTTASMSGSITVSGNSNTIGGTTFSSNIDVTGTAKVSTSMMVGSTDAPARDLEIKTSNPHIRLTDTDGGYTEIFGGSGITTINADKGQNVAGSVLKLSVDATDGLTIDSSHNVSLPNGNLNVTGTAVIETGSGNTYPTASTSADNLVISDKTASTPVGITIFSDNASQGNIFFGDENDADNGRIVYDHNGNANTMSFYANGAERLSVDSTGIDVTGTVTADGLTVENTGSASTLTLTKTDGSAFTASAGNYSILGTDDSTNLYFKTNGNFRQLINSNGDISFYEDTGTTAKLFWDASAESLGIGTSSPTDKVQLLDSGSLALRVESSGATAQSSVWTENNSSIINGMFVYGSTASSYGAINANEGAFYSNTQVNIMSDNPSGAIKFSVGGSGGSERMRIDSSGHLIVPNGVTLGTAVGTYAASNTLDDYEEGTWTPSLNAFTGTLSRQVGRYTKVGNLVTAFVHLDVSVTGGSGDLIITGLPFTAANVSFHYGSVSSLHCANWSTTTKPDGALINPNTTNAPLYKSQGQVGVVAPTLSDLGTGNILGVFVYETA